MYHFVNIQINQNYKNNKNKFILNTYVQNVILQIDVVQL